MHQTLTSSSAGLSRELAGQKRGIWAPRPVELLSALSPDPPVTPLHIKTREGLMPGPSGLPASQFQDWDFICQTRGSRTQVFGRQSTVQHSELSVTQKM